MDLKKKKEELINLIIYYLSGDIPLSKINDFSWGVIDYFTDLPEEESPPVENFENEFWYAIWQIQHLADKGHESEGVTKIEFERILKFLKGKNKLPKEYYGSRP